MTLGNAVNSATTNLYDFDPDYVGRMISENNWLACWEYMGQIIENLTLNANTEALLFSLRLQKDFEDEKKKQYVKDFGALLGELFLFLLTTPASLVPDKSFYRIIFYHEVIHSLFYIYDLDNTDEAVKTILGDGRKKLSSSEQKKLLLLLSLNTSLDIVAIMKSIESRYKTPALISYFSHRKIFRANNYNNKIRLYELRKEFERAHETTGGLVNSTNVFFLSSYLNIPERHIIKQNINASYRTYLSTQNKVVREIRKLPPERSRFNLKDDRKTVMVFAEDFSKNHAMYRCYGGHVKSIEEHFNVVLVLPLDKPHEGLEKEFQNFATFRDMGELYKLAHDIQPDILYMPSVGMRIYNIFFANLRIAPIQIQSLGHPATTMSEFIDYMIGPGSIYDERAFPTDIYVNDKTPGCYIPLISREKFFAPAEEAPKTENKKTIKVAVVGTDIKVSYPFFNLLKNLVEESPFEIHVSFMMGIGGIDSLYIEKYLQENFKNSTYHGWQPYEDYIKAIKGVDIVLNSFPFGHTNTIIDTLMCGKPCLGMDGIEPSSKTEGYVLDLAGLKEQFVAKDEADYKAKFYTICERILKGDTNFFDRETVYDRVFDKSSEHNFGKVFKWISDNHAEIKKSGKKYFEPFDEI